MNQEETTGNVTDSALARWLVALTTLRCHVELAIMLAMLGIGSCAMAQAIAANTPPKSITVVLDDNYPPFIFRDSRGEPQGILKDSWAQWESHTGIAVNLLPMEWSKALEYMQSGRADVIDTVFATEARRQIYDFTAPYATLEVPIFFHRSISGIAGADSLKGFTVGVKNGDACLDVLRAHRVENIKEYPSYTAIIAAAAAADIRVFCIDHPPAVYLLNQMGIEQDFRHSIPLYTGEFHRAVRKGDSALLKIVEDGFSRISTAEQQEIERKWYGSGVETVGIPPMARNAGYALLGAVMLMLALALWNMMLRGRVRVKTAELSSSLVALDLAKNQSERALAQLTATLEAMPDLFFEVDLSGRYHAIHSSGTAVPALVPVDFSDKLVSESLPPDAASIVMAAVAEASDSGHSSGRELTLESSDRPQWFALSVARRATPPGETPRFIVLARDITESKLAQRALSESEERYRTVFLTSPDAVNINRLVDGRYLDVNDSFLLLTGWTREEVIGRTSQELSIWQNIDDRNQLVATLQRDGHCENLDANFVAKDGRLISALMSAHVLNIKGEQCILSVSRDITLRKQSEDALRIAAAAFDAQEGIFVTDPARVILRVNKAFTEITGYSAEEAVGKTRRQLNAHHLDGSANSAIVDGVLLHGKWQGEVSNRRKDGTPYTEWFTVTAVLGGNGKITHYVGTLTDITVRKSQQQQLEHQAHFDVLTNLPNRALLADRLHQAIIQAQRRNQTLAVAYMDLDGFKAINDRHGHEVGDQLLVTVSNRMKQALREGDTLARLGGDEFVAVLLDLNDVAASVPLLMRVLSAAAQPVQIGTLSHQVSASIGVTFFPQAHDIEADQLMRQADQAMYQAKLAGKNRFHFFDTKQDSSIRGHHESVGRIREALVRHEFVLYYQPKVNMRTGAVLGVEALMRWQHPEQGLLPPALFLPVIEDHPLAIEIGEWALERALQQIRNWQTVGLDIPISVNVGARQLQQPDFVERLRSILTRHPDVRPDRLELEVLETSALEDLERASTVIEACRDLGVSFALDDFGTGYSSLTYLKHLRVTLLKIDRSFVRDMLDDRDDLAILEGVIGLASAFRCKAIAEGVETVAHGALLLQLGCELAQGYCIARPMLPADLPAWLKSWQPDPAWANLHRVSRDNLPVLRAAVEYRAWITGVESFLKGERPSPPTMDPEQLRFGKWLSGEGQERHGTQSAWQTIEALHQEAHSLAEELLALRTQGQQSQALDQLGRLHGLRDVMLHQLTSLEQESRPGDLMV